MRYAFFVGCTTLARLWAYEISTRKLAEHIGIELLDMSGSGCCGTTYLETLDQVTGLAIAARNICIAEDMGVDIVTICNGCTEVLTKTNHELKKDPALREKVNEILSETGRVYKGTVKIKHFVRMLKEDIGLENLSEKITNPLKGFKVGAHYGCHIIKPSDIMEFDDPEAPTTLDELIEITGAKSIKYPNKLECCTGPIMGIREDITWSVGLEKINTLKEYADAMITCCPFCYLTYERCQLMQEIPPGVPVIHIPQLLGLAMGLGYYELGLGNNGINPSIVQQYLGTTQPVGG
jgi:heterodisulfide reductase subunit B